MWRTDPAEQLQGYPLWQSTFQILHTVEGKGQFGVRAGAYDIWDCVASYALGAGLKGMTIGI